MGDSWEDDDDGETLWDSSGKVELPFTKSGDPRKAFEPHYGARYDANVPHMPIPAADLPPPASWEDEEDSAPAKPKAAAAAGAAARSAAPAAKRPGKAGAAGPVIDPNETEFERKMRLQAEIEKADLDNALDLVGAPKPKPAAAAAAAPAAAAPVVVRGFQFGEPKTLADFTKLAGDLAKEVHKFEKNPNYLQFLEKLVRELYAPQKAEVVKNASVSLNAFAGVKLEEQKAKENAAKKQLRKKELAGGASKKGTAKNFMQDLEDDQGFDDEEGDEAPGQGDYDDFM